MIKLVILLLPIFIGIWQSQYTEEGVNDIVGLMALELICGVIATSSWHFKDEMLSAFVESRSKMKGCLFDLSIIVSSITFACYFLLVIGFPVIVLLVPFSIGFVLIVVTIFIWALDFVTDLLQRKKIDTAETH